MFFFFHKLLESRDCLLSLSLYVIGSCLASDHCSLAMRRNKGRESNQAEAFFEAVELRKKKKKTLGVLTELRGLARNRVGVCC